jgi:hypothetical protein
MDNESLREFQQKEFQRMEDKITNISWVSNDQAVGQPLQANLFYEVVGQNDVTLIGTTTVGSTFPTNSGTIWITPNTDNTNPYDNHPITFPNVGAGTSFPPPLTLPSSPSFTWPPPPEEKDAEGNRVVKAPSPSLELILVEIAKVLKDKGDILQVREIFERYKLKLVDHDGEVIFDPREIEKLENKGF